MKTKTLIILSLILSLSFLGAAIWLIPFKGTESTGHNQVITIFILMFAGGFCFSLFSTYNSRGINPVPLNSLAINSKLIVDCISKNGKEGIFTKKDGQSLFVYGGEGFIPTEVEHGTTFIVAIDNYGNKELRIFGTVPKQKLRRW